jgi:hypothetical protein
VWNSFEEEMLLTEREPKVVSFIPSDENTTILAQSMRSKRRVEER